MTLKLRCYLFLKGAGNQPAELAKAVVDSVTAPFLNYLRKDRKDVIGYFQTVCI